MIPIICNTPHPNSPKPKRNAADVKHYLKEELRGLILNGTFLILRGSDVQIYTRFFGSYFILGLTKGYPYLNKESRLAVQNDADMESTCIVTKVRTVQRSSQRIILFRSPAKPHLAVFTRDTTQANIQIKHDLERNVFIQAPTDMGLSHDSVLPVVRPLSLSTAKSRT